MKNFIKEIGKTLRLCKLKIYFWVIEQFSKMNEDLLRNTFNIPNNIELSDCYFFRTNIKNTQDIDTPDGLLIDNINYIVRTNDICKIHVEPILKYKLDIENIKNSMIVIDKVFDTQNNELYETTRNFLLNYNAIEIESLDANNNCPLQSICLFHIELKY